MAETNTSKRKLISGTNAVTVIVVSVGIAVLVNAIASQLNVRWDMTENDIYTLSEASEEAVKSLDEPVLVKAFISPDMPPPFQNLSQQVADVLNEYQAASSGKMTFEIINPKDDDAIEEDARGYGCEKVALGQQTEDEVSLRAVYKCIAFTKGEETEVIKDLRTTGNPEQDSFEYDFTKAILNLRNEEPRKVGFVAGFGGPADNPQFLSGIQPVFEQLYGDLIVAETVNLGNETPSVAEDISALVLLNPDRAVSDKAKFAIDQYVQRGGSVGWYQSASGIDQQLQQQLMQQMQGQNFNLPQIRKPIKPELNDLFGFYGIEHNLDLLLDRANGLTFGVVMTPQGPAMVSHPATFQITDIDRSAPFVSSLPPMAIPAPSSLEITEKGKAREDIEIKKVLITEPTAVSRTELPTNYNYQEFIDPNDSEKPGPFVVAATLEGDLPSYFDTNALPEGITEDQKVAEGSAPARILVVGSGEFFNPQPQLGYDQRLAGIGGQFLLNSLEWLAQDSSLTKIRNKAMPRLIGEVPAAKQRAVMFINIGLVPALFALIGLGMMFRRRKRRENLRL